MYVFRVHLGLGAVALVAAALMTGCSEPSGAPTAPPVSATSSAPVKGLPATQPAAVPTTNPTTGTGAKPSPWPTVRPPDTATLCANQTRSWTSKRKLADPINHRGIVRYWFDHSACADQIKFEIQGPGKAGFDIEYVDLVYTEQGPLQVAPGATLRIGIRAPAAGYETVGPVSAKKLATPGERLKRFTGSGHLRELWFTDSSESHAGFALVVDRQRHLRVSTVLNGSHRIVIIEVARY